MTPLVQRLLFFAGLTVICIYLSVAVLKGHIDPSSVQQYASDFISGDSLPPSLHDVVFHSNSEDESLAYITFLSGTVANQSDPDINNDHYFVATRLLGYQLMHQPETSTRRKIPYIVLVTSDVPSTKRERLSQDGAKVIEVDYVDTPAWVIGEMPQWKDLMTKLRAWQLTKISRALFLDGDMILNAPLDGVFDEPATHFTNVSQAWTSEADTMPLPSRYLLATVAEANPIHAYPPTAENKDFKDPGYFNAGFFLFGPSQEMFDYYTSFLDVENSFNPKYVEQNLLNHAHRQDGPLPWKHVDTKWNIRFPSNKDRKAGVKSQHDKWWHAHMDPSLQPYYRGLRWRMEGFYEAMDDFNA